MISCYDFIGLSHFQSLSSRGLFAISNYNIHHATARCPHAVTAVRKSKCAPRNVKPGMRSFALVRIIPNHIISPTVCAARIVKTNARAHKHACRSGSLWRHVCMNSSGYCRCLSAFKCDAFSLYTLEAFRQPRRWRCTYDAHGDFEGGARNPTGPLIRTADFAVDVGGFGLI